MYSILSYRTSDFNAYLPQAARDIRSSQETLIDIFKRIENFFLHLKVYTEVPPTPKMMDMMVKIIVTLLGTWPTFFLSFLSVMYLYDHMTLTHMTAYLYNRATLSGTPLFPSLVRFPLFSSYGSP